MLLPVFARDVLDVGAPVEERSHPSPGAGALAAGIALATWGSRVRRGRLVIGASLGFAAALIAFAQSRSFPLSLALLAVTGFMMILNNATVNGLLQTLVPDRLRGRVMSVYVFMFIGMAPLGALQAGAVSRWLSASACITIGAVVMIGVLLWIAWRVPELGEVR
jgi:MFS family permease